MTPGEIYKWVTSKARGHEARRKIHVFCYRESTGKNIFLFINSDDKFSEGFKIKQSNYPALLTHDSYIGCTSVTSYTDKEISQKGSCICSLIRSDVVSLIEHIEKHEILELRHKKAIATALRQLLN